MLECRVVEAEKPFTRLAIPEVQMDEAARLREVVPHSPLPRSGRADEQKHRGRTAQAKSLVGTLEWHVLGRCGRYQSTPFRPGRRPGRPPRPPSTRERRSSIPRGLDTIVDVSPGLSDPNWWPAPPPPKPPPKIPASAIAIGAIVVVVAAAGIGFALLNPRAHHSTGPSVPVRSLAAFTSCLKQQGVLIPSAEFNDAMLRPAAIACRASVPLLGNSR